MIVLKIVFVCMAVSLPLSKSESQILTTVVYPLDSLNQLITKWINSTVTEYMGNPDSEEYANLQLPSLPTIVFSSIVFSNQSLDWNSSKFYPSTNPKEMMVSVYINSFQCAFLYEYSIKKGYGTLLMEGISMNFSVAFNFSSDIQGLGFEVLFSDAPTMLYENLQFEFENQQEFTDGVNFICENLPTDIIMNQLLSVISFNMNNKFSNKDVWIITRLVDFANLFVGFDVRVLNISIVQLEDNGLTDFYMKVSLVYNMTTKQN